MTHNSYSHLIVMQEKNKVSHEWYKCIYLKLIVLPSIVKYSHHNLYSFTEIAFFQSEETCKVKKHHQLPRAQSLLWKIHERFILSWMIQVDVPGIIQVLWRESSKIFNGRILPILIKATHCFSYITKGEETCHHHFGTHEIPDECQSMAWLIRKM